MSEQAVLSATGLTKTFSDGQQTITVLEDLNLEVSAGEWLAIVGASGACLLYTSPSPRDKRQSRMPSSA